MVFLEFRDEEGGAYLYASSAESLKGCIAFLKKQYELNVVEKGKSGFSELVSWDVFEEEG